MKKRKRTHEKHKQISVYHNGKCRIVHSKDEGQFSRLIKHGRGKAAKKRYVIRCSYANKLLEKVTGCRKLGHV